MKKSDSLLFSLCFIDIYSCTLKNSCHLEGLGSPTSASSSLLSYDRSSLKLDSNHVIGSESGSLNSGSAKMDWKPSEIT